MFGTTSRIRRTVLNYDPISSSKSALSSNLTAVAKAIGPCASASVEFNLFVEKVQAAGIGG